MTSAYNSRLYTLLERVLLNTKEPIYSLGGDRLYLHACKKIRYAAHTNFVDAFTLYCDTPQCMSLVLLF